MEHLLPLTRCEGCVKQNNVVHKENPKVPFLFFILL